MIPHHSMALLLPSQDMSPHLLFEKVGCYICELSSLLLSNMVTNLLLLT